MLVFWDVRTLDQLTPAWMGTPEPGHRQITVTFEPCLPPSVQCRVFRGRRGDDGDHHNKNLPLTVWSRPGATVHYANPAMASVATLPLAADESLFLEFRGPYKASHGFSVYVRFHD